MITVAMVKSLRDRTGAGITACSEALKEAAGDEDSAVDILDKKGILKVAKRAGAIAAEGIVHAYIHPGSKVGVLLEINCQTDFVARNEDFKAFANMVAMQIAAMSPQYVRREDVPADVVQSRKVLFAEQIQDDIACTGKAKSQAAIDKIIEGKFNKWCTDVCLVDQEFVMDDESQSVQAMCDKLSAKIGEKIHIRRFVRFERGEGIAQATQNFADEVNAIISNS